MCAFVKHWWGWEGESLGWWYCGLWMLAGLGQALSEPPVLHGMIQMSHCQGSYQIGMIIDLVHHTFRKRRDWTRHDSRIGRYLCAGSISQSFRACWAAPPALNWSGWGLPADSENDSMILSWNLACHYVDAASPGQLISPKFLLPTWGRLSEKHWPSPACGWGTGVDLGSWPGFLFCSWMGMETG